MLSLNAGLTGANARLLVIVGVLLCASPLASQVQGIPRFHEVNEHIYRGAQPSELGLQELVKLGINTILDLRAEDERSSTEKQNALSLGMRYVSIPMRGFKPPTLDQVSRGLQVLQTPANWPVFVHCRYGVDRTGTLIACYRIQAESWSNERARLEAEELGMHKFERGMKRFILQFDGGRLPPTPLNPAQ